jgi:hypothetical protein
VAGQGKSLLRETKVSVEAQFQMGMAVIILSVNDRGFLGYPTARSPKDGFMPVPTFAGHGSEISSSSWAGKVNLSLCLTN